jgi:hypothetical protein
MAREAGKISARLPKSIRLLGDLLRAKASAITVGALGKPGKPSGYGGRL